MQVDLLVFLFLAPYCSEYPIKTASWIASQGLVGQAATSLKVKLFLILAVPEPAISETVNMLPETAIQTIALGNEKTSCAFSVGFRVDEDGKVEDVEICKSLVRAGDRVVGVTPGFRFQ